ncbi:FeoA family protein [Acidithiobacillus sp. AMEEHan]|uniref:FeoA family protein n=1 Tax=Acidithiobacillus sp. AMEEHan TaxID=2994951 RepID=UPI0027E3C3ED|nr:FeoA family protein [Acidithiobacillus sp. AMEEHan]
MQSDPNICALGSLKVGSQGRIHRLLAPEQERLRLQNLGLRPGSSFHLRLGPDRRGVVLESGGTRVALGKEWLEQILVIPAEEERS